MLINSTLAKYLERSSWIRKMFEKGAELKKKFGPENVFDFSLGNPDLPPPQNIVKALDEVKQKAKEPLGLGYLPNAGLMSLREKLAAYLSQEQEVCLAPKHVILTCGAAGGLNVFLKTVLEPEDEVICFAPYFVEYGFYVANHGGNFKVTPSKLPEFSLDLEGLAKEIGPKTRVVLLNSPNNPCGQVYSLEELEAVAKLLEEKSKEYGRPVFLVADEPYRFLTYDGVKVPAILSLSPWAVVISSFSKSLGLAGERIGYIAVSPNLPKQELLLDGLILANRILGFVNAPVIGQYLVLNSLEQQVDTSLYARRRQILGDILTKAGLDVFWPKGGFYFFPKAPQGKEDEFIQQLLANNVLAVPGKGFGCPGYVRFAFCVSEDVIQRAEEPILRAVEKTLD